MQNRISRHKPVLLEETIEFLQPRPGGYYIDGTIGSGGHTAALLERCGPDGRVLGIDRDLQALERTSTILAPYIENGRLLLVHSNFADLGYIAVQTGFQQVQGILLDLGFSSDQMEDPERGFSIIVDGPLDMRLDQSLEVSAADLVNTASEEELSSIIWRYGEEQRSRQIARRIVEKRKMYAINCTSQLAAIVAEGVYRRPGMIHPATRTFQALRIAVNNELEQLEAVLPRIVEILAADENEAGRMAIITFHSLEDRIVKGFMRYESLECVCSPRSPICTCDHRARLRLLTKKAVKPSAQEIQYNPRCRSAKLRVSEALPRE